jgi:hypothetical protein
MIIVIPEKIFCKKVKKYVRNFDRGYCIVDATTHDRNFGNDEEGKMGRFKNKMSMDSLTPRKETLEKNNFTGRSTSQLMKEFFASYEFLRCAYSIIYHQGAHTNINVFIVYSERMYNAHGKKIAEELQRLSKSDQRIVFNYSQLDKDINILGKAIDDSERLTEVMRKELIKIYKRKMKISKSAEVDDQIISKKKKSSSLKKFYKNIELLYGVKL